MITLKLHKSDNSKYLSLDEVITILDYSNSKQMYSKKEAIPIKVELTHKFKHKFYLESTITDPIEVAFLLIDEAVGNGDITEKQSKKIESLIQLNNKPFIGHIETVKLRDFTEMLLEYLK